ncbi:MAG: hypothetical protein HY645_04110 [Acidobacteria bacterium]|nr:hypothetical protein [Acidobacteriota bacterium]
MRGRSNNLVKSIQRSRKNARLDRLIYALGIPHVGRALAADLATYFTSIGKLARANKKTLRAAGFGQVVSSAISEWLSNRQNRKLI